MAKRKVDIDLDYKGLEQCLEGIGRDFQGEGYGLERLFERYRSFHKQGMEPAEGMEALIRSAAELTSKEAPMWEFAAARLRYCRLPVRWRNSSGGWESGGSMKRFHI